MPITAEEKQSKLSTAIAAINAMDAKAMNAFIENTHPEYEEHEEHWEFLEDTYNGGREWFEDNIFKFIKEGDIEYKDRIKRAYRPNHTKEVVDLVNKYIFKSTIARKEADAPDSIQKFWNYTTLNRRPIGDFMRLVSEKTSIYGKVWCVVDSTLPDNAISLKEAATNNARIYSYLLKPQDVLDMAFNDLGELEWIKLREWRRDDDLFTGTGQMVEYFRIWTKDYWLLFKRSEKKGKNSAASDKKYELVDSSIHEINIVPVIDADHTVSENPYYGNSLIDDVAYLDRAVANYLSNLDAIVQDQTFSQLVIPAQSITPDQDGQEQMIEMGTKRIFTYDSQGGNPPEYISPDPKQASIIVEIINKIISEIYHTVGMAGERTKQDNSMGIDNSSGVAKAYDFERMNAMLANKAKSLEHFENKLVALVKIFNGEIDADKAFDYSEKEKLVHYPANFDVRSLYDEFEIAKQLLDFAAPPMLRKEQMKGVAEKLFPGVEESILDGIKAEIDEEWPVDPLELAQKQAEIAASAQPKPAAPSRAVPTSQNRQGQNTTS